MHVEQLMTKPAITCKAKESLAKAAKLMWEHDCGVIPVVGDDGKSRGMITNRDICMAAFTQGKRLSEILAGSIMTKGVFACSPRETVTRAEQLMRGKQVRRMPVVDEKQRVVGILSLNDLALATRTQTRLGRARVSSSELAKTLTAICKHRPHSQESAA